MVFMQPQRLIIPLFQRPYVWNETNQWAPLWADVIRVAERVLAAPTGRPQPHFLGAVVLPADAQSSRQCCSSDWSSMGSNGSPHCRFCWMPFTPNCSLSPQFTARPAVGSASCQSAVLREP